MRLDNQFNINSIKRQKKKAKKLIDTLKYNKNENISDKSHPNPTPIRIISNQVLRDLETKKASFENDGNFKELKVKYDSIQKIENDKNFNKNAKHKINRKDDKLSEKILEKQDKKEIKTKNPLFTREFNLNSTIGIGGSGRTFIGINKTCKKQLAIKYIKNNSSMFSKTPKEIFKQIVLNEITIHYNVGNQFIARSLGYFSIGDDGFAMLQELAEKGNLKCFLEKLFLSRPIYKLNSWKKFNILSESMVGYISFYLLKAIKHLYGLDVLHLDIKGENILVNDELDVKLTDFSVSVKLNIALENFKFSGHGTNCLMPLENLRKETVKLKESHKADIYSLGVMIYRFIYGCYPYSINSSDKGDDLIAKIEKNTLDFSSTVKISEELKDFLRKILRKDHKERADVNEIFSHKWIKIFHSIKTIKDYYNDKEKFVIDLINDDISEITNKFTFI